MLQDAPGDSTMEVVKAIMRRDLKLSAEAPLPDDMPLVGGDLDIDSLDVLLLLTSLEKEFGFKITSETVDRSAFATIGTLVSYIDQRRAEAQTSAAAGPRAEDLDAIVERLPHAPPFLFVSHLKELEAGVRACGVWKLSGDEPFFAGHFPGRPLVPGVLLAEALAQISGLAAAGGGAGASQNGHGQLANVNVRFREPVAPPVQIDLTSRVAGAVGNLIQFEVRAQVNGRTVAEGTLALNLSQES